MPDRRRHRPNEKPLKGWRQIAAFFDRDVSTVRRWAADRELPVFRASGRGRGVPVHAWPSELAAWVRDQATRGGMDPGEAVSIELANARGPGKEDGGKSAAEEAHPAERPIPERAGGTRGFSRRRLLAAGFCGGAVAAAGIAMLAPYVTSALSRWNDVSDTPDEARELVVRGSYLMGTRAPDAILEAIRVFGQAIDIHPTYAAAHAGLATGYNLGRRYRILPGWDAFPKAERSARRAIEIDPGQELAQSALAFVEFHWHWAVEESFERFERALGLNADSANTLYWYASALIMAGRGEAALPHAARALELDTDSSAMRNIHAQALFQTGRAVQALEQIEEIRARDPNYPWSRLTLYYIRLAQADYEGYLDNYAMFGDMIGVPRYREAAAAGRSALGTGGVTAMAEAMVGVETAYYQRGEALAFDVARHLALIGNADDALSWLRSSFNRHEPHLITIRSDPAFRPIREEPGFGELLAKLGLPPGSRDRGVRAMVRRPVR